MMLTKTNQFSDRLQNIHRILNGRSSTTLNSNFLKKPLLNFNISELYFLLHDPGDTYSSMEASSSSTLHIESTRYQNHNVAIETYRQTFLLGKTKYRGNIQILVFCDSNYRKKLWSGKKTLSGVKKV